MPNDDIRSDDRVAFTQFSIADHNKKRKFLLLSETPTDWQLVIIAAIIIALTGAILFLFTRQYMVLIAANAPLRKYKQSILDGVLVVQHLRTEKTSVLERLIFT